MIASIFDTDWAKREALPAVQVVSASGIQQQSIIYKDLKESALLLSRLLTEQVGLGPEDVVAILRFDGGHIERQSSDLCILYLELAILLCGAAFLHVEKTAAAEMLQNAGARLVLALEADFEFLSHFLSRAACPFVSISALFGGLGDRTMLSEGHTSAANHFNSCWISWSPWDEECSQGEQFDVNLSAGDGEAILQVAGVRIRGGLLVAEHRNAVEYVAHRWESRHFERSSSAGQRKILFSPFLQEHEGLWTADVMAALASGSTVMFFDDDSQRAASARADASASSTTSWDCIHRCNADVLCCSPPFLDMLQRSPAEPALSRACESRPILSVYHLGDETPSAAAAVSSTRPVQLVSGRVSSGLEYSWLQGAQVRAAADPPSALSYALRVGEGALHGVLPAGGKASVRIVAAGDAAGDDDEAAATLQILRVLVRREGEQSSHSLRAALHVLGGSARTPSRPRPEWKVSVGKDGRGSCVEVDCRSLTPSSAGSDRAETREKEVELRLKGSAGDGFAVSAAMLNREQDRCVVLPGHRARGVATEVEALASAGQSLDAASACDAGAGAPSADGSDATIFALDIPLNPRSVAGLWIRVGGHAPELEAPSASGLELGGAAGGGAGGRGVLGWQRLSACFNAPFAAASADAAPQGGSDAPRERAHAGGEAAEEGGQALSRAVVYASWRSALPSPDAFDWRAPGEWQAGAPEARVFVHCPAWGALCSDSSQGDAPRRLFFSVRWEERQHPPQEHAEQPPSARVEEDGARQGGGAGARVVHVVAEERAEEELMDPALRPALLLLAALFQDVDAFKLAEERGGGTIEDAPALTYGEIEFVPFVALLQRLSLPPGGSFCDLGCGSGRAVLAAASIPGLFSECVGVELLPELAEAGERMCRRWEEAVKGQRQEAAGADGGGRGGGVAILPLLRIEEGDILETTWWHHCAVVYVASLCFDTRLLNGLSCALRGLNPGALVLSLERLTGVARQHLVMTGCESMVMSWGVCEVFVYRRC